MKKNYTAPEIQVTKYVVETEITTAVSAQANNLLFTTTGEAGKEQVGAVQVVDYTKIFGVQ
jgi:hypothetical protein